METKKKEELKKKAEPIREGVTIQENKNIFCFKDEKQGRYFEVQSDDALENLVGVGEYVLKNFFKNNNSDEKPTGIC